MEQTNKDTNSAAFDFISWVEANHHSIEREKDGTLRFTVPEETVPEKVRKFVYSRNDGIRKMNERFRIAGALNKGVK